MKTFALGILAAFLSCTAVMAQNIGGFEHINGNVYLYKNGGYNSLVVATSEGVIVADPVNSRAATRLQTDLPLITDQTVSHLIYSHSHGDHASGGSVFTDTAKAIAHANAPRSMNGVRPDIRFDQEYSFTVGANTIELTYLGPGHSEDLIATVVRPENVMFLVDLAAPEQFYWTNFGSDDLNDLYQQIRTAEALDFDIILPGHGRVGTKAELTEAREYFDDLRAQVLSGLQQGKSVDQLVSELTFEDQRHWRKYDAWRAGNVSGMANFLIRTGEGN